MASFSDVEQSFIGQIADDRLRTSLALIREAVEDLWAPESPRIVRDYTDHGIAHSVRLARLAARLLQANDGSPLKTEELYLLIAGIYLHDIGMQCDVVRHPAVHALAEKKGARFDVTFTAATASGYTLDEQKAIRANHQYLSAAWIEHAIQAASDHKLNRAMATVPTELASDLAECCKYHSRLPIRECSAAGRMRPSLRTQLVAALLRFADELDVDVHRVLIETDTPYLAPVPHRGQRNEPAWVLRVAETLAGLWSISLDEVASITTRNFESVFGVRVAD